MSFYRRELLPLYLLLLRAALLFIYKKMQPNNNSLWYLSNEVIHLDDKIHEIMNDESLTETEKSIKSDQLFEQYLTVEESFKDRLLQCAELVHYEESIANARKQEADRVNYHTLKLRL